MTAPTVATEPARKVVWYARPGIVLPVLFVAVVASALLTRTVANARDGDPRLTTYSTEPLGAALLYDLSARLGWRTSRIATATPRYSANEVVAVFDPTIALRAEEVHALLEHVRRGGGLISAFGDGTSLLSDSLDVEVEKFGSSLAMPNNDMPRPGKVPFAQDCKVEPISIATFSQQKLWIGPPTLFALKGSALGNASETYVYVQALSGQKGSRFEPRRAMIGMQFEKGRIVIASDPDVFRNDALRECSYGFDIATVQALEYLRGDDANARTLLAFDEFHLGRGGQVGFIASVQRYLSDTPSGHSVFQLAIAGLVLLLAAATRVLPPVSTDRVDRRSPLEHVDALARAYSQVGATRTGALRLVRGLRRRIDRSASRKLTSDADDAFLLRIADTKPALKSDVELVRKALDGASSREEFRQVGNAVARIEANYHTNTAQRT